MTKQIKRPTLDEMKKEFTNSKGKSVIIERFHVQGDLIIDRTAKEIGLTFEEFITRVNEEHAENTSEDQQDTIDNLEDALISHESAQEDVEKAFSHLEKAFARVSKWKGDKFSDLVEQITEAKEWLEENNSTIESTPEVDSLVGNS